MAVLPLVSRLITLDLVPSLSEVIVWTSIFYRSTQYAYCVSRMYVDRAYTSNVYYVVFVVVVCRVLLELRYQRLVHSARHLGALDGYCVRLERQRVAQYPLHRS